MITLDTYLYGVIYFANLLVILNGSDQPLYKLYCEYCYYRVLQDLYKVMYTTFLISSASLV